MAFDWRDFFLLAHELQSQTEESKLRTSVGRAYYYAYNIALTEAKRLGYNPHAPSLKRAGVHQRLWSWYQNQSHQDMVALGDAGNTLKARRTSADYVLWTLGSLTDVQKQLHETREFEVLLARIARRPPPLPPETALVSASFERMHHVGFVVQSIAQSMPGFLKSMQATWDEQTFHDPIQSVKVAFLSTSGSDVQIELVEPTGERNPVAAFLAKGGGLHHVCYEVEDCDHAITTMRQQKALIVKRPQPAAAFGGRRIAWMLTAEKLLVEFLETKLK